MSPAFRIELLGGAPKKAALEAIDKPFHRKDVPLPRLARAIPPSKLAERGAQVLTKLISVRNLGRFRNSAQTPNPELRKVTLITGANGYGKTTLCALLRSLQRNDADILIGRQTLGAADRPTVELLWEAAPLRFDGTAWSAAKPEVRIFDSVFVAENVHAGEVVDLAHKRNLYRIIVGAEGVRLAEEDTALSAASREKTGQITQAARAIERYQPRGMPLDAFRALRENPDIENRVAEQERAVAAARQATAIQGRAGLTPITLPTIPERFSTLLAQTLDGIGADAEAQIKAHFERHDMVDTGSEWATVGVQHIREEECPFCEQSVRGLALVDAYRAVFSEQYRTFTNEISRLRQWLGTEFGSNAQGRLENLLDQNVQHRAFWSPFCGLDGLELAPPYGLVAALQALGQAAVALADQKSQSPLASVALSDAYATAHAHFETIREQVSRANDAIAQANIVIEECRARSGAIGEAEAQRLLDILKATRVRHSGQVARIVDAHDRLRAEKQELDTRRDEVRNRLNEHTNSVVRPYEERINELLGLFNAGFLIADTSHHYPGGTATSSYNLVINDTAVDLGSDRTPASQASFKNTLSAGDRTTLALAFFIAHLERDPNIANAVVVFDDPFNSQDAFRRRQTILEIMKIATPCKQIIVLSHDASFLKMLWDKAAPATRVSLGINDHRAHGSKICEIDLERTCRGRNATDLDDLQTFLNTGAGVLVDLMRKMRVVLEAHLMASYPASFAEDDWLGDMVRKIREGGDQHPTQALYQELDEINGYSSQYHHRENVETNVSDQIDRAELTGFVRRTLVLVNATQV